MHVFYRTLYDYAFVYFHPYCTAGLLGPAGALAALQIIVVCCITHDSGALHLLTRTALGGAHLPPTMVFRRLKTTRRCFDRRPIPVRGIFPT